MTVLNKAVLTLEADVDGDTNAETGVFEMRGNLTISPSIRTGYLVGGRGSTVNSVATSLAGKQDSGREGFRLDLGGGALIVEIEFDQWEGSPDQWGNTGDSSSATQTDATGAKPATQMEVLIEYLNRGEFDSRNPARLEYGEHHSDGLFSALDVVVEGPNMRRSAKDGSWFSGTLTCISVQSVNDALDATSLKG